MGSRVEYFLVAAIVFVSIVLLNIHIEPIKVNNSVLKNTKSSELNSFTEFEINATTLLHTLKAKQAYEDNKTWYIKDVNITNKDIKSLTAKNSIYEGNKIVLNSNVKVVKADGIEYMSEKAIYKTDTKELLTPTKFTIKRKVDIVQGKELRYDVKQKATIAKDVKGTFILKK